ncbi:pyridoxal kinase PdxY [Mangrovicella endophytica]|uniref:pyridoxal kinase PdxY n=1 Tax=Mangrovicella endophytica TaxID=2066697 RepID=UPI000C9EAEFA|nr:pyridoxal kinase PdxY [Mangrovicella endophytica]
MSSASPSAVKDKPAILSISSHVVRGTVGNRAIVLALESLGFPVWSVPTVTLPWHPGHGPATRLVPPAAEFSAMMADLERAPWLGEIGGVITGYFGAVDQVEPTARLVAAVRRANPKAVVVCDPIIGDGGRLYQPQALVAEIRDRLLPLADVATPNRFELEVLTGLDLVDNNHLIEAAAALGPETVMVTSAYPLLRGGTGNLLVGAEQALLAEHRLVENAPHGLGDLTSAVFLARILSGIGGEKALQSTTAAVFEILARTAKRGADELTLETDAESLKHPMAMVQMRRLSYPSGNRRA